MNSYVIIVIIFFIVIFIIILSWIYVLKTPPNIQNIPQITYSKSSYGMRCSLDNVKTSSINLPSDYTPQHCDIGLSCINYGKQYYCKVAIGYECTNLEECTPLATKCDGICLY